MNSVLETSPDFWKKALLAESSTMQQAIASLDDSKLQIVLVVSLDGSLLGTITDGDIRRGLLCGLTLSSPVGDIMNCDPLVVPPQLGQELVLQIMQANGIRHIPVINEERKPIGLHTQKLMFAQATRPNTMVIMAGGKGSRLRPHTENCPKPLLPVGDRPILERIILQAKADGICHFLIAVNYLAAMIEEYFEDGSRWNVQIEYLKEHTPLGTAGALSLLKQRPSSSVIVTNGDVLTGISYGDLIDFHDRSGSSATMAVRRYEWQNPFGVVHTIGSDIVRIEEKPVSRVHVNAGVYVLIPEALDVLSQGQSCDMPIVFERLKDKGARTIVYPLHEAWIDVGRREDLERARMEYKNCE